MLFDDCCSIANVKAIGALANCTVDKYLIDYCYIIKYFVPAPCLILSVFLCHSYHYGSSLAGKHHALKILLKASADRQATNEKPKLPVVASVVNRDQVTRLVPPFLLPSAVVT
jgi:hypothetical protein